MWSVRERKDVQKVLKTAPEAIRAKYFIWRDIVERSGPQGLQAISGFFDKGLTGPLSGWRESRLSGRCRVIYEVQDQFLYVEVIEITRDHTIRSRK
jgi:mRNA-degrading endonuclease RelE of RelBE toxin-antitoxin system